ncbi:unnamed protein product [Adineta ricciae]|uniref:DALR anticodon binding domain-containing protein n=2 Tax=Adineta ricciae TaxID=249248 RepID=A0A815C120_ADIRI|nr:unnamed protein product [Adineta ricciae]
MARSETSNFSHPSSITGLASTITARPTLNQTNLSKDPNQLSDNIKNEFLSREGTYKISSFIDNLGKSNSNTCLNEPVKITLMTRLQPLNGCNSETSSMNSSSTLNNNRQSNTPSLENQPNEQQYFEMKQSAFSNGVETSQQNGNMISTQLLTFNIGRELIMYEFTDSTQSNFNEPIDHRIYKQNHQPTCHDVMQISDTNALHVLVGFSKGQIQYINMQTKEQKVFNEASYLDKTKVTCIKWLTSPRTHFAVSYSSGNMYVFDEQLNHQRDANIQATYTTIKDDEKNFVISYLKNKSKNARNPVSRWSIGNGSINEFAFSPDRVLLAIVSQDGFLRIFNYEKMELVTYMKSYFGGLLCVCWSPDGKYLATGGEDDFMTLFSLDPEEYSARVLCRGHGHTSWISAISFDPYMNEKNYYSSFNQRQSSLSLNDNDEKDSLKKSASCSRSSSSCFDTNIPSLFYRIASVGQDNRLCFWDITEDILRINQTLSKTSNNSLSKRHSSNYPVLSNGYSSFLSDTTPISSTNSSLPTTKSSFSSLTARLSFARNSNKVHKSIDETSNTSLTALSNGSSKKTRRLPLLSHTMSTSKSTGSSSFISTNASVSNDSNYGSLSTISTNSTASRRTNFDLTKSTFGTHLCPRLDEVQIIEPVVTEIISNERLNGIYFDENCFFTSSQDGIITIWGKPHEIQQTSAMSYLFVIWLGEKPIEKVFTSFRILLWSNVLKKLAYSTKSSFLMMFDSDMNRSFVELIQKLNLMNDNEEQSFLQISTNDQQQTFENLLKSSPFISFDSENRMMINIEHVESDYLVKSSNESSIRIPDDPRLFDKLSSLEQVLEKCQQTELKIIHFCDFQSQYQCELFVILFRIIYSKYIHLKQSFLTLAPAVLGDDRPSTNYNDLSFETYMKEVLANVVNERTSSSSSIPMAMFKLQLMCRKPNSIVHLRSNIETNHDMLFLLYTGARLVSILNTFDTKYQNARELFETELGQMLTSKDEQEFLKWTDSFESRFLVVSIHDGNRLQINLDKIFQELVLFSRRLSPYYSKVRILTENQSHLHQIMFARLELIERIVTLFRRTLSLVSICLIERM